MHMRKVKAFLACKKKKSIEFNISKNGKKKHLNSLKYSEY